MLILYILYRINDSYEYFASLKYPTMVSEITPWTNWIRIESNRRRETALDFSIVGLRGGKFRDWNKWHSWTEAIFRGSGEQHYRAAWCSSLHALQGAESTKYSQGECHTFPSSSIFEVMRGFADKSDSALLALLGLRKLIEIGTGREKDRHRGR